VLLEGKKAIVTGGGSGIGRATCRRLAEEGATVAVIDLDARRAEATAAEVGGRAFPADVTDFGALERAVADATSFLGGLSVLCNNAGASAMCRIHEWPLDEWERIVRLNLTGVFHGIKAGAPRMLEGGGGAIVNTASISGTRPAAGEAPYAAAKAGVAALTAAAALEYGPAIRVNAVSPGLIRTAMTDPLVSTFPGHAADVAARTPLGRLGEPEDVASVIAFLCSDLAAFVTGQNLVVDGGLTLRTSAVDGVLGQVEALLGASRSG
jgi:NAD(P)-dependent dehydrogenase (short-subunit alcohol dehydrogenase family)